MKRKQEWMTKLTAVAICVGMIMEPFTIYADSFTDGTETITSDKESRQTTETQQENQTTREPSYTENVLTEDFTAEEFSAGAEEDLENDSFSDVDTGFDEKTGTYAALNGSCGDNAVWSLQNGILTIEGTGEIYAWYHIYDWITGELKESRECPWKDYASSIKEIDIKDGITAIGASSFSDLPQLEKVVIADTVKCIRYSAFANDTSLKDITIGNSVEEIDDEVFHGVPATKLVFPASVKSFSSLTFNGLWEVTSIEMPDNGIYKSVDGVLYADKGKTLLRYPAGRKGDFTIPPKVNNIASDAFTNTRLTSIVVPSTVKSLGEYAFSYSEYLKSIVFMGGTAKIPDECCTSDWVLDSVTIGEGVTSIGDYAFWGCDLLKSITLPSTVSDIGKSFDKETKITFLNSNFTQTEDGSYINGVNISVNAKEVYSKAFEVLDIVNKERTKRGIPELKMDASLLDSAMLRGFETALYWSHTRPNGSDCNTANKLIMGENIACGSNTAQGVMKLWMNSSMHKSNILEERFTSIGIGCVYLDGSYYWVQCFGEELGSEVSKDSYTDHVSGRTVLVKKNDKYYGASLYISEKNLKTGQTAKVGVNWKNNGLSESTILENIGAVIESSNPLVCTIQNGILTAVGEGTATISMQFAGNSTTMESQTVKVTKPSAAKVKVTFNANGGSVSTKSKTVLVKSRIGKLPVPRRKGYTFVGWYTAKMKGKKVSAATKITKKQTIYAHWKKI